MITRSRRRRQWLIAIAAVLAAIVPLALVLGITWWQAVDDANQRLDRYASLLERRTGDVFGTANDVLGRLVAEVEPACSEQTLNQLRKAVYTSLYFREAGLILDDRLVCSSLRRYEPPLAIDHPDQLRWPERGIHISAPAVTAEGEVSVLVLRGGGPQAPPGFAVNLLLDPRALLEPIRAAIDETSVALRVERADGTVLARAGNVAVTENADTLMQVRRLRAFPLVVVVSGSRDELLDGWWDRATMFIVIGLGLSLPLFLFLAVLDRREHSLDAQLRDAIEAGELRVHYQPIHEAGSLRVIGCEALLRWEHPVRGLVLPGVFVPMAEDSGLIIPITEWLMAQVRRDLDVLAKHHPKIYVAINLAPRHFADPTLPDRIVRLFGEACAAHRLVLELTERELLTAADQQASRAIETLRGHGARIALDDFGTGYSSLSYLAQFRFDLLKIDKSFIDAMGTGSVTAGLVEDMVAIARRLGLATIAEGVETDDQIRRLREIGVNYLQGWQLSPALPLDALLRYVDGTPGQG